MSTKGNFFQLNMELLRKLDPKLAEFIMHVQIPNNYGVLISRTEDPVLTIDNKIMWSIYDPHKHARTFVERCLKINPPVNNTVTVVGFGFGYHIEELVNRGISVRVIEPDAAIFRLALEYRDLRNILDVCDLTVGTSMTIQAHFGNTLWYFYPKKDRTIPEPRLSAAQPKNDASGGWKQALSPNSLNILVVSPIYGGSLPIARYCNNALRRIGHLSTLWDASVFEKPFRMALELDIDRNNKKILCDLFQHLVSEMIVASCAERRPDIVLCLAQAPLSLHALDRLRESGITSAFWFVEDFRHMQYWKQYAPAYDFYFTIQKGEFFEQLKHLGTHNYAYLPVAAAPEIHKPLQLNPDERAYYGSDLSFLGAGYYNRQCMFRGLLDFDFKIWGTEWDRQSILWQRVQKNGERINSEESVKIFNATKININLHSSAYYEGIDPEGDFINPRTFEIAACGAFQLVDERREIDAFFLRNKEIVTFSSLEDLREKAQYYLYHPEERQKIARAARQRIINEHTYEHRMRELCAFIFDRKPEVYAQTQGKKLLIRDVNSFCKEHPETRSLLEEVVARGLHPDIDGIVTTIRLREGEMQYPEALFMILKEYQTLVKEHLW
ncbi:MAG: glycosyltransferase [Desulfobacterota bacterium]|nr:glycosyltransferase [Thermodesulfobacteriota bacterium]